MPPPPPTPLPPLIWKNVKSTSFRKFKKKSLNRIAAIAVPILMSLWFLISFD